ncbi:MAG: Uma2 family endonuclease [Chloroflexi bacterium]|nr:Uma2 family endonuclease [Chloroflexota bacterium]
MSAIPQTIIETAQAKTKITGEELLEMGDIGRCELIEGEIINIAPTGEMHGIVEFNLGGEIRAFVRQHKLGRVSGGEVGIFIRRMPDTVRGADIVFISNERLANRGKSGFLDVAPDLIVEVLSPDDRWNQVTRKLEDYFSIGVRLVWVVDPENEIVHAYRALTDIRCFGIEDTLTGDDVLPGFTISLADVFAE